MKTGSTNITERVGQTVIYTLNEADVRSIVHSRLAAGTAAAHGNDPRDGDSYPALIVRDFGYSGTPQAIQERADAYHRTLAARYRRSQGQTDAEALAEPGWPSEYTDMSEKDFAAHLADALAKFTVEAANQARTASVNLQVFLDGIDVYWATSRSVFDAESHGRWVQVVDGVDHDLPSGINRTGQEEDIEFRPDRRGHWWVNA